MRALFAFAVAAAFGLRVAVSPFAWGCATEAHHASGGAHHHQEHRPSGPDLPACECVAHAAPTGLVVEHPARAVAAVQPPPGVARYAAISPVASGPAAHRLPFSIGPPPSLS